MLIGLSLFNYIRAFIQISFYMWGWRPISPTIQPLVPSIELCFWIFFDPSDIDIEVTKCKCY